MPATGGREGDAKNARLENVAPDCNGRKCRTGKCGTNMQGGKCEKQHCMEHCVFLMTAQSCKMRPLSMFKRG